MSQLSQPPPQRFSAHVHGRVQGVGYRVFVDSKARALGLAGSVRNLRAGGVWVEAEGPREHLDALLTALRKGPPAARVQRVDVTWETPRGVTHFEIGSS